MKVPFAIAAGVLVLVALALPARADFCLQLNGGAFSGDIGFFRFKGALPKTTGKIAALRGRAAGLSPVFGTATVAKDGTYVEIGATFFIDGVQGQFDVSFLPPTATSGGGAGAYGAYGTGDTVTAAIVNCATEP
jgi:hypothetical protein